MTTSPVVVRRPHLRVPPGGGLMLLLFVTSMSCGGSGSDVPAGNHHPGIGEVPRLVEYYVGEKRTTIFRIGDQDGDSIVKIGFTVWTDVSKTPGVAAQKHDVADRATLERIREDAMAFSWTPSSADLGVFYVEVSVSDSRGASDEDRFAAYVFAKRP